MLEKALNEAVRKTALSAHIPPILSMRAGGRSDRAEELVTP